MLVLLVGCDKLDIVLADIPISYAVVGLVDTLFFICFYMRDSESILFSKAV